MPSICPEIQPINELPSDYLKFWMYFWFLNYLERHA